MRRGRERTTDHEPAPGCVEPELGRQLGGYARGELDELGAESFEEHLLSCPSCAEELETRIALGELLDEQRRPVIRRGWIAAAAAAVLIIAAAGIWILPGQRPAQPREVTLTPVLRGAEATNAVVPGQALRLRLVVQVPRGSEVRYTVILREQGGGEVERFAGVPPSGPRTLTVTLERGVPRAGDYLVEAVEEVRGEAEPFVTRFLLRARGRR